MTKILITLFLILIATNANAVQFNFLGSIFGRAKEIYISNDGTRIYKDGTYAESCDKYKTPTNSNYKYSGNIGNGIYKIQPTGVISPYNVDCNMSDNTLGTIDASGGVVTYFNNYKIHTFTSGTGSFTVNRGSGTFEYLVIGGGAAGGGSHGGGGGAGGFVPGSTSLSLGNYNMTVGNGGAQSATNGVGASGSSSTIVRVSNGSTVVSAAGGGGGGFETTVANAGASGGGGPGKNLGAGGVSPTGQGNSGGNGSNWVNYSAGGGGGSGGAGQNAPTNGNGGSGGIGLSSSITGNSVCYAGGGGGSSYNPVGNINAVLGPATCGGGNGGRYGGDYFPGLPGTPNTGGGGGGMGNSSTFAGAAGGSGVIIIRYIYKL